LGGAARGGGRQALYAVYPGLATPAAALGCRVLMDLAGSLHSAGQAQAPREMGGDDAGLVMAWINSVGNAGGFLCPPMALMARKLTGSWRPYFLWVAASQLLQAALYLRYVSLTPARVLFDEMGRGALAIEKTVKTA
jgi:hypothetical protein